MIELLCSNSFQIQGGWDRPKQIILSNRYPGNSLPLWSTSLDLNLYDISQVETLGFKG